MANVVKRVDILVLEDHDVRIEWLREYFPDAVIMWAQNVTTFEGSLKYKPRMILLDHDLGPLPETGYDAAKLLPDTVDAETPVLIWSQNPVGADNIKSYLKSNGFTTVVWLPFGIRGHELLVSLKNCLSE